MLRKVVDSIISGYTQGAYHKKQQYSDRNNIFIHRSQYTLFEKGETFHSLEPFRHLKKSNPRRVAHLEPGQGLNS